MHVRLKLTTDEYADYNSAKFLTFVLFYLAKFQALKIIRAANGTLNKLMRGPDSKVVAV